MLPVEKGATDLTRPESGSWRGLTEESCISKGHMGNILLKHHKWRVGLWQIRVLGPTTGQWLAQNVRQDWSGQRGSSRNLSHYNPSPGSQALPPLPQNSRPSAATSGGGLGRRCCHLHPGSLRLCPSRWNKSFCSSSPSLWSHVCDQTWEKTIACDLVATQSPAHAGRRVGLVVPFALEN